MVVDVGANDCDGDGGFVDDGGGDRGKCDGCGDGGGDGDGAVV